MTELNTEDKHIISLIEQYAPKPNYVPYQVCPICQGNGEVPAYDMTSITHQCDICNGAKIIPMHIIDNK